MLLKETTGLALLLRPSCSEASRPTLPPVARQPPGSISGRAPIRLAHMLPSEALSS
jgi:hypothetical protein